MMRWWIARRRPRGRGLQAAPGSWHVLGKLFALLVALGLLASAPLYAQRTVVIINLRGGFDSLYAVQPYSSVLNTRRPYLFQEADDLTFLPSRSGVLNEGVHHEFPELVSAYNADEAVIIHLNPF